MMSTYEPWNEARGAEIIAEHDKLEGATLVILHAMQAAFELRGGARHSDDRFRAPSVARRSPWRVHVLPRLPPRTRWPPCAEAVPCRSLSGSRWGCARGARRSQARYLARQHH